jgi:coenzyme F420-reducing hydrogenase beta subunit
MAENHYGECTPVPMGICIGSCTLCLQVCPFSNEHKENEDTLGKELFSQTDQCIPHETMGWVRDTYVGYLSDDVERLQSPSGGLGTEVLTDLLRKGEIDAAIVPQPLPQRPWFEMQIVDTEQQIYASRGSVYHMLHMGNVLNQVLHGGEKKYAIMGLPCMIKGIRLMQKRNPVLKRRIAFCLGLACGGCRNIRLPEILTELVAQSKGSMRYRSKEKAIRANDYSFELCSPGKKAARLRFDGLFGFLYLNGFGGKKACLFCDDIFAELADAAFMDAWLPEYINDRRGTSLVISRNPTITESIKCLLRDGTVKGGPIAQDKVARSQQAVVAKKRNLLAERSIIASKTGFVPQKRFYEDLAASNNVGLDMACRQLAAWNDLHELSREIKPSSDNKKRFGLLRSWWKCCKVYCILRKHRIAVQKSKALLFMGWLSRAKFYVKAIIKGK